MGKKVWIFGDSFTDSDYRKSDLGNDSKCWIDLILSNIGIEYENLSRAGQSNEGIYLSVIDSLEYIQPMDIVFVSWSTNLRFLNISENEKFETYLSSDKNHYDIWDGSLDIDTVFKLNTPLNNNLKFSICVSGLSSILKRKDVNFKFINGHNEFNKLDVQISELFPNSKNRVIDNNIQKYFDVSDFLQFDNGYCLLNEFFMMQIKLLPDSTIEKLSKVIKTQNTTTKKFFNEYFKILKDSNKNQFIDTWHLNSEGHVNFSKIAQKHISKILNK